MIPSLSGRTDWCHQVKTVISGQINECHFVASDSALQLHFGGTQMTDIVPGRIERRVLVYTAAEHLIHWALTTSYWHIVDPKLRRCMQTSSGPWYWQTS